MQRLPEGIERTGAYVSIDDAESGEHQSRKTAAGFMFDLGILQSELGIGQRASR